MKEKKFLKYLLKNNISQDQATIFISQLNDFNKFLNKENNDLDSIPNGKILDYTERLVEKKNNTVLDLLRAVTNYGNFTKKYDYIVEVIDIAESYNAMDNLYQRITEQYNKKIRDKIFDRLSIPPLGVHPEKKPEFTKVIMKRLEENLGEEKTIELLKPCLHGRPGSVEEDRETFLKLNDIDEFLKVKQQEILEKLQKHQKEGTLEFAQFIDDEVVEYIKNELATSPGKREGTIIIDSKMPYQTKRHLNAKEERMKRFYSCYCPWVRGAIKNGTDKEISPNFCHCSAGYTKIYWDKIFNQPTKVEPIETALTGGLVCKFAVHIPKEFQK